MKISEHKLFPIWNNMKTRCYNKNNKSYKDYGGRGITVCDRWLESIENFSEDMGKRPSLKHSTNRIDNNGNYCKENCQWATYKEQARNTRRTKYINYKGKTKSMAEWAEIYGINYSVLEQRLRGGLSISKSLNTKVRKHNRKIEFIGKLKTLSEWSKECGIPYGTLYGRIYILKRDLYKCFDK